ncbi:MAG: YfiR family protein [Verrucomicrobia bacterium]|nr:YfiR family protein [Verrucomicrobiota bacterium]
MSRHAPVLLPEETPTRVPRRTALAKLVGFALRLVVALTFLSELTATAAPSPTEYQVKATFLFHFTHFVEWPARAFAATNAPLTIGLLGTDPFGEALDSAVAGETVNGHKLVVKRLASTNELAGCHLLFLGSAEPAFVDSVLDAVKSLPLLTVSETDRFCQHGGMIRLYMADNKVKFDANRNAAVQAGLRMSSKMLNLPSVKLIESERP